MNVALYPRKARYAVLCTALGLAVVAFLLVGCSLPQAYVALDRKTHDRIAPDLWAYVEADPAVSPTKKTAVRLALDSWDARIAEAEGSE